MRSYFVLFTASGGTLRTIALRPPVIYGEGDVHHIPKVLRVTKYCLGYLPNYGSKDTKYQKVKRIGSHTTTQRVKKFPQHFCRFMLETSHGRTFKRYALSKLNRKLALDSSTSLMTHLLITWYNLCSRSRVRAGTDKCRSFVRSSSSFLLLTFSSWLHICWLPCSSSISESQYLG